ncbi:MAG: hypothetical protein JWQ09_2627 [Segetibacter sp.]|nr:hypothetical protein [Segetibacter sp.]
MAKAAKKAATTENKTPKKAAAKALPKKAAAKTANKASDKKGGKKGGAGLMAPLTVSPDLANIVGKDPLPRTEIIKKIWDYIKANDLQDKNNRRMINADEKLKVVFDGKDQVSMFELAKIVNNHVKK